MADIEAEEGQQAQQTEQSGDGQQLPRPLDPSHHHQVAGKPDGHADPQQEADLLGAHPYAFQPEGPERQIGAIDEVEGTEEQG